METKRAFWIFAILTILTMVSDRILFVIFPNYLIRKNFSATEIGLIFSIASFILLILRTFVGKLSDVFGRKIIMSFSLFLQSISVSLYPTITKIYEFSLVKGLQEVSGTLSESVKDAIIADVFGRKIRAKIMSKLGTVFPWSRALGAMVGFFIVTYIGLIHGFYFAAMALFLSFILFSIFIEEKRKTVKAKIIFKLSLKKYSKKFLTVAIIGAIQALIFTCAYFPAFFVLAKKLEITESLLFVLLIIDYIISGFFVYWSGRWIDKFGRTKTLLLSFFAFSLFTFFYPFSSNILEFLFVLLGVSLAFYLYWIAFKTVLMDFSDRKYRGEQIGFAKTLEGIGSMFGPILGGFLIDNLSLSSAFFLASSIGVFTSLFIYFSRILHQ